MDSSGSINWLNDQNYGRMKDFINQFLDYPQFDIDNGMTRVALVYFSDFPVAEFDFRNFSRKAQVQNAVTNVPYLGFKTDTSAALNLARTIFTPRRGDRPQVANAILILTDGESTSEAGDTVEVAQSLRVDNDISVYTVGITRNIDRDEVERMSGLRGTATRGVLNQHFFLSPTFTFDEQLVTSLSTTICRDVIVPTPPPPTLPPVTPPPIGTVPGRYAKGYACACACLCLL